MNKAIAMVAALVLAALTTTPLAQTSQRIGDAVSPVRQTILPTSTPQGAMVVGTTHGAATVMLDGRQLRNRSRMSAKRDQSDEVCHVHRALVESREGVVQQRDRE